MDTNYIYAGILMEDKFVFLGGFQSSLTYTVEEDFTGVYGVILI